MHWYKNRYRRHLCDMHIEDWDDSFLSRFDPQRYADLLVEARIDAPMLYFQSHVGYCYYPTRSGKIHRAFEARPNGMRRLVDLCHERGMAVVGYYSLNYNTWAHDVHPDWRMLQENGKSRRENDGSRYGLCCPNNMDYRAFVMEQIGEMLDYFTVEGMFYDMPFWPHLCFCDACRRRWADEAGGPMPRTPQEPRWEEHLALRRAWMGEWTQAVTDETKRLRPHVSVEHNYAAALSKNPAMGTADPVNDACDYTGGDLYGGFAEQSFSCKYYLSATRNAPFEYMTGRCDPSLRKHTVTKSADQLTLAALLTCAHHGATLLIDAIDPAGTMDERVYRLMGEVFSREIPYEPYLRGELAADVGVVYHQPSKPARHEEGVSNHFSAVQTVKTIIGRHIPCGVVTGRQWDRLGDWPILVAPQLHSLSAGEEGALADYVRGGGILYLSGDGTPGLLAELLGARTVGRTDHAVTYLAPLPGREALFDDFNGAYPLPFDASAPLTEGISEADVLATVTLPYTARGEGRYASIHSNPPGIPTAHPAVAIAVCGRGRVIWAAQPLEAEPIAAYGRILVNLLTWAGLRISLCTDAPRTVELVSFRQGDTLRVSAVHLWEESQAVTLPPFEVRLRAAGDARAVRLLPGGEPVPWRREGDWVCFETRPLRIFDMYEIEGGV